MPARSWRVRVSPRRRVRSRSSGRVPSGSRWARIRSPTRSTSSGVAVVARRARVVSASARSCAGTASGILRITLRMVRAWSAPISPSRCAAAVSGRVTGRSCPVRLCQVPRSLAAATRAPASALDRSQQLDQQLLDGLVAPGGGDTAFLDRDEELVHGVAESAGGRFRSRTAWTGSRRRRADANPHRTRWRPRRSGPTPRVSTRWARSLACSKCIGGVRQVSLHADADPHGSWRGSAAREW